jgi:hypothetical protein
MHGMTPRELKIFRKLTTPAKIQDFLDAIPINFEIGEETCFSPRVVLRQRKAHCMEGAMLGALALRLLGYPPLVMDLKVTKDDDDHVVAVFKSRGYYGAISKTNHGTVRYRDPVYRTLRELAMSYFHEYTTPKGRKVLRSYSRAVDLSRFDRRGWMTSEEHLFFVPEYIDDVRHYPVISHSQIKSLRNADPMERKIGAMVEWGKDGKRMQK